MVFSREDLSGRRYGMWTVLYHVKGKYWYCRCDCGTERNVLSDHLKAGETKCCGCVRQKVHIGDKFGQITVLEKVKGTTWLCRCSCGETFTTSTSHLRSKKNPTAKCAKCSNKERTTVDVAENGKAYSMWKDMIYRCEKPSCGNYRNYGARGIAVCEDWKDFSTFLKWLDDNGYDKNLGRQCSIERIDVNGDYCPQNCKIAGAKEQANNKRNSNLVTIGEETKTVSQWCEETGINRSTAYHRIKQGWSDVDAVTLMPSKMQRHRRKKDGQKEGFV